MDEPGGWLYSWSLWLFHLERRKLPYKLPSLSPVLNIPSRNQPALRYDHVMLCYAMLYYVVLYYDINDIQVIPTQLLPTVIDLPTHLSLFAVSILL